MKYRQFGKLGWEASALGFGCMRLPTTDGFMLSANVDEAEAIRMIRRGIDEGINYVDNAYPYHGGNSEVVVGKALKDGYREKVKLATKSPVWQVKKAEDFDTYLNEQLGRLQTDHLDVYLLHGLDARTWKSMLDLDVMDRAEEAVRDGRIGHIGF
ncbi:MAG: aldo/keto reductase, partial [Actinobacteria bacterium]|nr:aldo/keto reductase [Actinomycetota bacterium]